MINYGIKFARDGKRADSSDPRDLVISSDLNTLKIAQEIQGKAYDGTTKSWTDDWDLEIPNFRGKRIKHNLGYKPIVFFYLYYGGSFTFQDKWMLAPSREDVGDWGISCSSLHVDENQLDLWVGLSLLFFSPFPEDFGEDLFYKCYILVDPRFDAWYE